MDKPAASVDALACVQSCCWHYTCRVITYADVFVTIGLVNICRVSSIFGLGTTPLVPEHEITNDSVNIFWYGSNMTGGFPSWVDQGDWYVHAYMWVRVGVRVRGGMLSCGGMCLQL